MSAIRVLVGSTVEPENLAEVIDLYRELVRETRKENGCISYELLRCGDNSGELMLVENGNLRHTWTPTRTPSILCG